MCSLINDGTDLLLKEIEKDLKNRNNAGIPIFIEKDVSTKYKMKFKIKYSGRKIGSYYLKGCFFDKDKQAIELDLGKKICAPYEEMINMELVLKTPELLKILAAIHNNKGDQVKKILDMLFCVRLTQTFCRGVITLNTDDISGSKIEFVSDKNRILLCNIDPRGLL